MYFFSFYIFAPILQWNISKFFGSTYNVSTGCQSTDWAPGYEPCVFYWIEISFRCRNSSEKSSLCLHSKTLLSTVRTPYSGISIARISHSCACRLMCLFARQTSQKNNTHHTDKQTSHVFAICHLLNRMSNSKLIRKSCRNK